MKYILMPFILGGAIAYILNFFVKFFEKLILNLDKKNKLKTKQVRMLAMLITYLITFVFIVLLLKYIIPQFYSNIKSFVEQTPGFIETSIEKIRAASIWS